MFYKCNSVMFRKYCSFCCWRETKGCVEVCEVIYNKKSNIFDFFICYINIYVGMLILYYFYDKICKFLVSVLLYF